MGMPGAGKDTQALLLEKAANLTVIRVGDEVRKRAKLDKKLEKEVDSGALADESVVDGIVQDTLAQSQANAHLLSDGYPRSYAQAKALDNMCKALTIAIEKVVYLQIPEKEVFERLKKRGRDDDIPEVIHRRLTVFHEQTEPVLVHYETEGLLVRVDGIGTVEEVHNNVVKALQS